MSPESRKRKPARKKSAGPPGPDLIVARAVRDACTELERTDDPLQAEMYVSELLGGWWGQYMVDADPEVVFGEAAVARAGTHRRAGALALLRCIAQMGTEPQRAGAEVAIAELAAQGVAEPPWTAVLGTGRVTSAWGYGDVTATRPACCWASNVRAEHGVVVLVDHTLDGIAKDAFLTPEPSGVLSDIQSIAGPAVWVRELTPEAAAELLYPAFAASDAALEPPVNEDFRWFRALAPPACGCWALPRRAPPPVVAAARRRMIVNGFLGSDAGRELPEAARPCVELLVGFGCDVDPERPLRVSPAKIERFLADRLPGDPEPRPEVAEAMPATLRAWTRWAAEQTELPQEAAAELQAAVEEMLHALADGGFDAGPGPGTDVVAPYLDGVDLDEMDPESLPELLQRRQFTMPYFGTRVGDEDYPHLDASDPDERALLIEGEHPEYHDALADPRSQTVDGVNPRLHLAVHEVVANQLWDDDPPEAWQAAQRLLARGADRHDVLHMLGEVVTRHLHGALTGEAPVDLDAYVADLARLGASARGRGRTRRDP